jgi:heme/copper-type cytochrome/quinol oxidase subunit 1
MHFLGVQGIPRRYREYSPVFSYWHRVASLGRVIRMVATVLLFYIWWESFTSFRVLINLNWKGYFIDSFHKQPLCLHGNYERVSYFN